jgi:hypothetical protein
MAIRNFAGTEITIASLLLLVFSGIFISAAVVMLRMKRRKDILVSQHPEYFQTPSDFELYFYYLYELIESEKLHDQCLIQGMFYNHLLYCTDP